EAAQGNDRVAELVHEVFGDVVKDGVHTGGADPQGDQRALTDNVQEVVALVGAPGAAVERPAGDFVARRPAVGARDGYREAPLGGPEAGVEAAVEHGRDGGVARGGLGVVLGNGRGGFRGIRPHPRPAAAAQVRVEPAFADALPGGGAGGELP